MQVKDSRVVVTGGAGFIGSHLVDMLLARDNRVLVVDDFSSGSRDNLSHHGAHPKLAVHEADIRGEAGLASAFEGADFVFHLACRNVRLSLRRPTEVHEVNATGTLNVLKASVRAGVSRFLYCSSSEVHGTAARVPLKEESSFFPETVYGASKLTGEHYARVFHKAGWLKTVVARPHNNYGPRSHWSGVSGEAIPRFIVRALAGLGPILYGDGAQTRDFTYVEETAGFLIRLLEADQAMGGTFNVCRGEEVSIREIAERIVALSGQNPDLIFHPGRPSDVLRLWGDPSHLKEVLGESPGISIQEGLKKTFDWFAGQPRPSLETLKAMDRAGNWDDFPPESWLPFGKP